MPSSEQRCDQCLVLVTVTREGFCRCLDSQVQAPDLQVSSAGRSGGGIGTQVTLSTHYLHNIYAISTQYLRCPGILWLTAPSSSLRGSTRPPASRWRPRAGWASSRRSAWAASRAGARGCSAATRRAASCGRATSSSSAPCTATTSSPPSPAARTGSRWARALCVDSG